ncbi:MAG: hypothetical protein JNM70_13955 [Anaerolineae bacterium]|nr:hypothetical protein [Anaerolineae bacterium]
MTNYEDAIQLTNRLTLTEKVLLLEHLSSVLRHDIETEAYRHMPWEQFIDLTYGSLSDDPIERNQPLYPGSRD